MTTSSTRTREAMLWEIARKVKQACKLDEWSIDLDTVEALKEYEKVFGKINQRGEYKPDGE